MADKQESLPPFDTSHTFKQTQTPDPEWKYGQGAVNTPEGKAWLEGEKEGWKVIDTATENPMKLYPLMVSAIVPRPIAFVSTISADGVENLAPFSWFNMVTHNPPLISICCTNGSGTVKDTPSNIKATKGFTVNLISEPWIEAANVCSIDAPANVSEWPISGLTRAESKHVKPARVKESAFSMECELHQVVEIVHPETGANTTTMIIGLVKAIHVRNDVLTPKGTVDPARYKVVSRLGDITYARTGDGFRLKRAVWAEDAEKIQAVLDEKKGA